MKILVIEDENSLRDSIIDFLKVEGYLCEQAMTLTEGIMQKWTSQFKLKRPLF